MRFITLGLIALLMPAAAPAQDLPVQFSLQEAIAYALENNYSAINANRDLVDAQKQKWETIATGLPQIEGTIGYQDQIKQPLSLIPAEFFGGEAGTFIPIAFGPPPSTVATATLRQKIFDGSYIVGVQATQAFMRYSENNKEKTEQEAEIQKQKKKREAEMKNEQEKIKSHSKKKKN
jgi:outer membrane protein TolC